MLRPEKGSSTALLDLFPCDEKPQRPQVQECLRGSIQTRRTGSLLTWSFLPSIVHRATIIHYSSYVQCSRGLQVCILPICCFSHQERDVLYHRIPRLETDDLQYRTSSPRRMTCFTMWSPLGTRRPRSDMIGRHRTDRIGVAFFARA